MHPGTSGARGLGSKDLIEFTEIVSFKQPWERAFDTLTAFLRPGEPKRPADKSAAQTKRLAWLVDASSPPKFRLSSNR